MPNFDLTPSGGTTVRLYERGFRDPVPRDQDRNVPQNAVDGGSPEQGVGPVRVAPGVIQFRGVWIDDTDAETLALRLRDSLLNDPTVEDVDVQAVDSSGAAVSSPYNGAYRIGGETQVRQISPSVDSVWEYRIRLIES